MQCTQCGYVDGELDWGTNEWITGEEGKFYSLPITMQRPAMLGDREELTLYGCPKCKNVFMDY